MQAVRLVAAIAMLYLVWVLWGALMKTPVWQLGLVSCVLVLWLTLRMGLARNDLLGVHLLHRMPRYWVWLVWQMVLSNLQVLKLVLGPRSALQPRVVEFEAEAGSPFALALLGNSITITPGTLTIDIDRRKVTVHCLTRETADELLEGSMNRRIAQVDPD